MITQRVNEALTTDRARRVNASGTGGSGQGGALAARECTFVRFMKCNPTVFHGTKGAVKLRRWFEKTETVFGISECVEGKKVKFAAATLQGPALTWKFLRALHPKWRAKVTVIEESKDLSSLALDELIGNLKKESSDDETSTSRRNDKEYAIFVRNFKKFFRRKGKFVRQPRKEKKLFRQRDEKKGKSDRKCFRCGDLNHFIIDCLKPSCNKDQKAFIGGSWSDSKNDSEDKINDETCLMAQSLNEVCLRICLELDEWIKCSGCSKHMTDNKSLFYTYKAYDGGNVIFGCPKRKNHRQSQNLCDDFAKIMHDELEMSLMGELNFFLGLQIKQMEDKIYFNQSNYIKEMLKKFRLEDSKPTKMSMSMELKLTKDDDADSVDSSKYQGMIGSLLYLTASRPNIMFSVFLCDRFQENPKTTHLEVFKRIFRYIRGTSHLGLWYPKGTKIETIIYADFDHAGDYVDRKSTSGVCMFMGCCLTYWFAKKQTALAISMTEAEYVSAEKACQQALWMKQALIDYDICLDNISIMCDNKGVIDLSKNPVQHFRTNHIEIRHHFLRDNVQKGNISIEKVASEDNIADIFTKPLKCKVFKYLRLGLGMMKLIMDSDPSSSQK
nr:hypothetical protein [Tanacetum cinerariifolium]